MAFMHMYVQALLAHPVSTFVPSQEVLDRAREEKCSILLGTSVCMCAYAYFARSTGYVFACAQVAGCEYMCLRVMISADVSVEKIARPVDTDFGMDRFTQQTFSAHKDMI